MQKMLGIAEKNEDLTADDYVFFVLVIRFKMLRNNFKKELKK
jgi:hypothetical protein